MTSLRQVLQVFEATNAPLSLQQVAHQLKIDPGVLEDMILFWVRKGVLREVSFGQACTTCGSANGCPLVIPLPRSYQRISPVEADHQVTCLYPHP
jgi:FeoC like transcriptional regulator